MVYSRRAQHYKDPYTEELEEFNRELNVKYGLQEKGIRVVTPNEKDIFLSKEIGIISDDEHQLAESIAAKYGKSHSCLTIQIAAQPQIRSPSIKTPQPTECDDWQKLCEDAILGPPPVIYKWAVATTREEDVNGVVIAMMAMACEFNQQRKDLPISNVANNFLLK